MLVVGLVDRECTVHQSRMALERHIVLGVEGIAGPHRHYCMAWIDRNRVRLLAGLLMRGLAEWEYEGPVVADMDEWLLQRLFDVWRGNLHVSSSGFPQIRRHLHDFHLP